jgi:hypothetical protein
MWRNIIIIVRVQFVFCLHSIKWTHNGKMISLLRHIQTKSGNEIYLKVAGWNYNLCITLFHMKHESKFSEQRKTNLLTLKTRYFWHKTKISSSFVRKNFKRNIKTNYIFPHWESTFLRVDLNVCSLLPSLLPYKYSTHWKMVEILIYEYRFPKNPFRN